jgi:hypothetical protein
MASRPPTTHFASYRARGSNIPLVAKLSDKALTQSDRLERAVSPGAEHGEHDRNR